MKKILALIMSVLMLATAFCAVIPASAAATDIKELLSIEQAAVGAAKASGNDVTDATISPGEYTYSKTIANSSRTGRGDHTSMSGNDYNAGGVRSRTAEGTNEITLHMAHDADWIYVGIEATDAGTNVSRPFVIAITVPTGDTYGTFMNRLTFAVNQQCATATTATRIGTYTWGPSVIKVNEDGSNIERKADMAGGTDYDQYIKVVNSAITTELKVSKAVIESRFGLTEDIANIGIAIIQNKYGDSLADGADTAYYFSRVLTNDENTLVQNTYGVTSSNGWFPYYMYLGATLPTPEVPEEPAVTKTLDEIVNFRNYYVGKATSTAPTINDGKVNAGEYTFTQTLSTSDVAALGDYMRVAPGTVTGRDATDNIVLHMSSDNDYIYIAMESRQVVTTENGTLNKNFFTVSLSRPNPTTYAEMMKRLTFRMSTGNLLPTSGTVACTFSYNTVSNINTNGTIQNVSWGSATPVEAYATLTSDYTGITEMKISKATLATLLGASASDFDEGVGLALQHNVFNYKASGVSFDTTLPYGEVGCGYFQVLTDDQKTAIYDITNGLVAANVTNWAPLMMNFAEADVDTRNGASVRISTDNAGLRFKTVFDKAFVAELTADADSWSVGTLIAPTDTLAEVEFTKEALDAAGVKYLNVVADYNNAFAEDAATKTIAGSIVNMKEANLARDFSAIGYIEVDGVYYYSDSSSTTRNVKAVATIALGDLKAVQTTEYAHEVSAGVYSPYTAEQRVILSKLNGTYES